MRIKLVPLALFMLSTVFVIVVDYIFQEPFIYGTNQNINLKLFAPFKISIRANYKISDDATF